MKNFEYAQPTTEAEAVQLLSDGSRTTEVLAGGTDLVGLMKRMVVSPDRLVNICEIDSLKGIESADDGGVRIGAAVCLDQVLYHAGLNACPSVKQVIQGISSLQLQAQGTLVGELLRRPNCWYFRNGHGLLADNGRRIVEGDNRFHAILGNRGPAKFVSASRLAPALITLDARVRIIGPEPGQEQIVPLADLYRTPASDAQRETTLQPGQLVTHVILPPHGSDRLSAANEIRHGEGPDQPLAAAAVCLEVAAGTIRRARIVLGQVAPVPWDAVAAAEAVLGLPVDEATAELAGDRAVVGAIPLSDNEYRIQLARVAVKRAVLKAGGLDTGDFDSPLFQLPSAAPQSESLML